MLEYFEAANLPVQCQLEYQCRLFLHAARSLLTPSCAVQGSIYLISKRGRKFIIKCLLVVFIGAALYDLNIRIL